MRVGPFLTRLRPFVLEYRYIFESRVAFQIRDSLRVGVQHPLDFLVAHLRQRAGVIRRLHHDFMPARRPHPVVNSFGGSSRIAFNAIKRPQVGVNTHLPTALRRQIQQRMRLDAILGAQGTRIRSDFLPFRMPHHDPTACNRILTKFHQSPTVCSAVILYRQARSRKNIALAWAWAELSESNIACKIRSQRENQCHSRRNSPQLLERSLYTIGSAIGPLFTTPKFYICTSIAPVYRRWLSIPGTGQTEPMQKANTFSKNTSSWISL